MIVCNTKLSEKARRYSNCRGIKHIGWSSPKNLDLQTMITKKKLYLITFLKGLNAQTRNKFTVNGIVMLKQILERRPAELKRMTGLSITLLNLITNVVGEMLSGT